MVPQCESHTDPDVKYEYIAITSDEELQKEVNSSLNASASVSGIGIKAVFEQLHSIKCDSKTMTCIFRCTISHDPTTYDQTTRFKPSADALLELDPAEFEQVHVNYFIAGHKKTSSLSTIFTYNASSKEQMSVFKDCFHVGRL